MLKAEGIVVEFGGVRAVAGVDLQVDHGEFLGVIGPNGSGKTTLLNALCGIVPAKGRLFVDGAKVALGKTTAARRAGIARVFQAPQIYDELNVLENALQASDDPRARGLVSAWLARPLMWRREKQRWAVAAESLDRVGLAEYADAPASMLSYGQRRLLELARAIVSRPKVMILDEPSAGLNDAETGDLALVLRDIHRSGVTMILVDHKIDFLDQVCGRLVVLEFGEVIATGAPQAVWEDPRVVEAYLGRDTAC